MHDNGKKFTHPVSAISSTILLLNGRNQLLYLCAFNQILQLCSMQLNPKVHSPPFAANVVAAALYILYQEGPVFQPLASSDDVYMVGMQEFEFRTHQIDL